MKLTNYMRDAFIRAAMADVPSVDYGEQARGVVAAHFAKLRRAAFPRVDVDKLVEGKWLARYNYFLPQPLPSVYEIGPANYNYVKECPELWAQLTAIAAQAQAQAATLKKIETNLRAVTYSCTTRKALAAALPEFTKYMPADDSAAIRTLPVVANVVADFVKAGWPKGEKAAV